MKFLRFSFAMLVALFSFGFNSNNLFGAAADDHSSTASTERVDDDDVDVERFRSVRDSIFRIVDSLRTTLKKEIWGNFGLVKLIGGFVTDEIVQPLVKELPGYTNVKVNAIDAGRIDLSINNAKIPNLQEYCSKVVLDAIEKEIQTNNPQFVDDLILELETYDEDFVTRALELLLTLNCLLDENVLPTTMLFTASPGGGWSVVSKPHITGSTTHGIVDTWSWCLCPCVHSGMRLMLLLKMIIDIQKNYLDQTQPLEIISLASGTGLRFEYLLVSLLQKLGYQNISVVLVDFCYDKDVSVDFVRTLMEQKTASWVNVFPLVPITFFKSVQMFINSGLAPKNRVIALVDSAEDFNNSRSGDESMMRIAWGDDDILVVPLMDGGVFAYKGRIMGRFSELRVVPLFIPYVKEFAEQYKGNLKGALLLKDKRACRVRLMKEFLENLSGKLKAAGYDENAYGRSHCVDNVYAGLSDLASACFDVGKTLIYALENNDSIEDEINDEVFDLLMLTGRPYFLRNARLMDFDRIYPFDLAE